MWGFQYKLLSLRGLQSSYCHETVGSGWGKTVAVFSQEENLLPWLGWGELIVLDIGMWEAGGHTGAESFLPFQCKMTSCCPKMLKS